MKHVDEFVGYGLHGDKAEHYARFVLMYMRLPASMKFDFEPFMTENKLFCTYEGRRYRVTGASRLGDIWLTSDYSQHCGYELRVDVALCTYWRKVP